MRFSIIVPVYNSENYLEKCLDSINNQCFKDFEVILVDDGSIDKSPEICDAYAEQHHRFRVLHKNNSGVTSARKVGADNATGDYIVCVDSDDWILPTYLSNIDGLIENFGPDMIVGGWTLVNEDCVGERVSMTKGFEMGMYNKERISEKILPILLENGGGVQFSWHNSGKGL